MNPMRDQVGCGDEASYVVGGVPLLRRLATAVTSCAGANGFSSMTLCGTPLEVQFAAAAPLT